MATLRECVNELEVRKIRLAEAERGGWRDAIPSCAQAVNEMRHALDTLIERNMAALVDQAGDLDMRDLPIGISLAYTKTHVGKE